MGTHRGDVWSKLRAVLEAFWTALGAKEERIRRAEGVFLEDIGETLQGSYYFSAPRKKRHPPGPPRNFEIECGFGRLPKVAYRVNFPFWPCFPYIDFSMAGIYLVNLFLGCLRIDASPLPLRGNIALCRIARSDRERGQKAADGRQSFLFSRFTVQSGVLVEDPGL